LFEPAEPPEYLTAPATRILVQPQLTIATAAAATAVTVATDTIQGVSKRTTKQQAATLIKIEPAHTVSISAHLYCREAAGSIPDQVPDEVIVFFETKTKTI
jgi:hypothetical protein